MFDFADGITTGKFREIAAEMIAHWWRCKREDETERKATSLELSGVLPDGTKFSFKEYARDSAAAYAKIKETLGQMTIDHQR